MNEAAKIRIFGGQQLPLQAIAEAEIRAPGQVLLFEIVDRGEWRRFRQGFLIARARSAGQLTAVIRAYRQAFPGVSLYLSAGRKR